MLYPPPVMNLLELLLIHLKEFNFSLNVLEDTNYYFLLVLIHFCNTVVVLVGIDAGR